jgi:hypothetical protein
MGREGRWDAEGGWRTLGRQLLRQVDWNGEVELRELVICRHPAWSEHRNRHAVPCGPADGLGGRACEGAHRRRSVARSCRQSASSALRGTRPLRRQPTPAAPSITPDNERPWACWLVAPRVLFTVSGATGRQGGRAAGRAASRGGTWDTSVAHPGHRLPVLTLLRCVHPPLVRHAHLRDYRVLAATWGSASDPPGRFMFHRILRSRKREREEGRGGRGRQRKHR